MARQHCFADTTSDPLMQFIAKEQQWHPDMTSFWSKFSNGNGERFFYQKILGSLAKEHSTNAAQDAANAHFILGGDLSHPDAKGAFSYMKTGKMFLASKDDMIACKWIKLLKDDPDISSRWAVAQNTAPCYMAPAPSSPSA